MRVMFKVIVILLLMPCMVSAQSISFRKTSSWKELLQQADSEKKLVFVDVYTKWCIPCKIMDQQVFTLADVASFYNTNFVSYKLDAEEGEGVALNKQYGVEVYPTYLFIDPATGALVHKSTGRQAPDVFINTGRTALQPDRSSVSLEQQYRNGKRDKQFIMMYTDQLASSFARQKLDTVVRNYLQQVSYNLTDTLAWHLFNKYSVGSSSPAADYLFANKDGLCRQYGKHEIDRKVRKLFEVDIINIITRDIYVKGSFKERDYNTILTKMKGVPFEGKKFVMQKAEIFNLYRQKQYKGAGELAMQLPGDTTVDKKDLLTLYSGLLSVTRKNEDYEWIKYAVNFARYIAYNDGERSQEAGIHYNYAVILEKYIRLSEAAGTIEGTLTAKPLFGEQDYKIHIPGLAPKPQYRQ